MLKRGDVVQDREKDLYVVTGFSSASRRLCCKAFEDIGGRPQRVTTKWSMDREHLTRVGLYPEENIGPSGPLKYGYASPLSTAPQWVKERMYEGAKEETMAAYMRLAERHTRDLNKDPRVWACECGATVAKAPHSTWCPAHG